ncbi:hypothetical protein [Streptomyces decoyicus]|uniref:hypothetical protein n=1 Tax=Streptomyces decoyicus TaxID=249567 RepID=UPI003F4BADF1
MTGQASGLRSAAGPSNGAGVADAETGDGFLDPPGRDLLAAAHVSVLAQPAGPAGARRMGGGHGPGETAQPVTTPPQRTVGGLPRDAVRRQLTCHKREFRTPHAARLPGRPDPVDRGPLPVVEDQRTGAVRGAVGGAAQTGGQLQLRYEPVPDGERLARDTQSGSGQGPPSPRRDGSG